MIVGYWLNTTYACGLIEVDSDNVIILTCPIYKWMVGKKLEYVIRYLRKTNKLIEIIRLEE